MKTIISYKNPIFFFFISFIIVLLPFFIWGWSEFSLFMDKNSEFSGDFTDNKIFSGLFQQEEERVTYFFQLKNVSDVETPTDVFIANYGSVDTKETYSIRTGEIILFLFLFLLCGLWIINRLKHRNYFSEMKKWIINMKTRKININRKIKYKMIE
ncbi:MAG: hypothetical protein LUG18_00695 [Candidatus Azobacteroides sp.]|nr:hypothetical protein [Candidatus Azobacteroides sp.]